MSHEAWIMIGGITLTNLVAVVGGLVHIATRLTRIESDVKWIKRGCPKCQQNWDQNSQ